MTTIPETRFAKVGDDRVAYQVLGEGPRDLLYSTGMWSHLDVEWEEAGIVRFFRQLGSYCRLIRFDRRGTGLSDRPSNNHVTPAEHWIEDCAAVLDATGSATPVFCGILDSGPMILSFLERYPQRCSGLIFINAIACWAARPDYPEGLPPAVIAKIKEFISHAWGHAEFGTLITPSQASNPAFLRWMAKYQRSLASPRAVMENLSVVEDLDARPVLAHLRVPTLVMSRKHLAFTTLDQARYIAAHVADARFVELPGSDCSAIWETPELILGHIEEFITGSRRGSEPERALTTVMFTDIMDSTLLAAKVGDAEWGALLNRHDRISRGQIERFSGRLIERTGDGTLAIFENPGRAIDCAQALHAALASLDIRIRAGVHFGDVELRDNGRIDGMTVHIGARVLALAGAGEVLATRTVRDILIGSRYRFEERGVHDLKGVPGKWPVYAVGAGGPP